jgi:methyl-accepting chemotaxis protein
MLPASRFTTVLLRAITQALDRDLHHFDGIAAGKLAELIDTTSSAEISSGNSDLLHRTGQQAASLEETAPSQEELTASGRRNAPDANQLVLSASGVAGKGGELVTSSKCLIDIIGVIDGIALQTNILALNAAAKEIKAWCRWLSASPRRQAAQPAGASNTTSMPAAWRKKRCSVSHCRKT